MNRVGSFPSNAWGPIQPYPLRVSSGADCRSLPLAPSRPWNPAARWRLLLGCTGPAGCRRETRWPIPGAAGVVMDLQLDIRGGGGRGYCQLRQSVDVESEDRALREKRGWGVVLPVSSRLVPGGDSGSRRLSVCLTCGWDRVVSTSSRWRSDAPERSLRACRFRRVGS